MNEPEATSRADDDLARVARAWVVRMTSGAATDADAWQLRLWRGRSALHEAAFQNAVRLWGQAGAAAVAMEHRPAPRVRRRALLTAAGAAASVAGGANQAGLIPGIAALAAGHRTGTGEQRRLVLEDGSVVEMNTQTSLSVSYTPRQRHVRLIEGEAAFTVAPDPERPFRVMAADGDTAALGTVFAIRREAQDVRVACLSGRVRVSRHGRVELRAGEKVAYDEAGLGVVSPATGMEASWRGGMLTFRNASLAAVVAEINRYRPGHVVLLGPGGAAGVSGVFHLGRPDEMLAHVVRVAGLNATSLPGGIVILR